MCPIIYVFKKKYQHFLIKKFTLGQIKKKICVFKVTLPYLIFLVKPSHFYHVFSKKKNYAKHSDKEGWANNVDPDQTATKGAVWSESTLFVILSVLLETFKNLRIIKQTW